MRPLKNQAFDATCEASGIRLSRTWMPFRESSKSPDVADRLSCSWCGSKRIVTRPNWSEQGPTSWVAYPGMPKKKGG